jgi:HEPN domain-containing protein
VRPHERWLDRANYDLETAEAMYSSARYIYVVFMCQQALEKCLKALLVYQGKEVLPIHNLRRLLEKTETLGHLDREALRKIDFLSQYYLNARYKEDLQELSRQVGKDQAKEYLDFTREKAQWLIQQMTP